MNIINKKYKIINTIGSGSFGKIVKGQNIRTKEYVAIKIERIKDNFKLLKNESNVYQYLSGCYGIPTLKWFGKDTENYYMVIDLLGVSLQEFKNTIKTFSLSLVLKIGIKIISILKTIHEKGLIHRDIKPDNFLFSQNNFNNLYLIDFGFCKRYMDGDVHIPLKKTRNIIGSLNYASVMSHNRCELSRRDDLESAIYILFYFYKGILPWNNDTDENVIVNKKINIYKDDNCPEILLNCLSYIKSLGFEDTPNYDLIINSFKREIELMSKIN